MTEAREAVNKNRQPLISVAVLLSGIAAQTLTQDLEGDDRSGAFGVERVSHLTSVRDADVLDGGRFDGFAQSAHLAADGDAEAGGEGVVVQADGVFAFGTQQRELLFLQLIQDLLRGTIGDPWQVFAGSGTGLHEDAGGRLPVSLW